jgi:hypothetical protein
LTDPAGIRLTVIVGTTRAWPAIATCLDSIHAQASVMGAEVIAVDGHGRGLPADLATRYPGVTPMHAPGTSIFQMRAAAMRLARGEVLAVTEDHCRAAPDWCERIVAAHREWPAAAAVGGVVENGSPNSVVDWANFFVANGAAMPPVRRGPQRRVALQPTVSYKRRAAPRDAPAWGYMEWMWNEELFQRGEQLVTDDRICVEHVQPIGWRESCVLNYHDSRSVAGFRARRTAAWERLLRLAVAASVMAPLLFVRTVAAVALKRRHASRLLAALPWIAVLSVFRAVGAVVGFVAGAGRSPLRIR